MSKVRLADIPDMDAICELGREMHEQSVYAEIKPDEPKFRMFLAGLMGIKGGIVLVIVDDDDKPQGFIAGAMEELFYSRQRMATDIGVYVRESYRHLAPAMYKKFIAWAESKTRMSQITLGISSGIGDPERTGKMFESLGLSRVGGIFVKIVKRAARK